MIKQILIVVFLVSLSFGRIITDTVKTDYVRSNPDIDSLTGNVVVTGSPTITGTLTVDTLKSTKGINATGGTFSGRVTGSDLQVGDSVIASAIKAGNTIRSNGALSGYNVVADDRVSGVTGSFDSTRTRVSVFDSIKLGSGSYMKTYLDTTFYDSLFDGDTYTASRGLARIVQVGKTITLYQPPLGGTISGSRVAHIRGIPSKFINSTVSYYPLVSIVENGTSWIVGTLRIAPTIVSIQKGGMPLAAGTGGIQAQCITWIID